MIDFDALVLSPCMEVFAEDFTVDPRASQPFALAYAARGVWTERPVDVDLGDGRVMSSAEKVLGIRLSEFTFPPIQGDFVTVRGKVFMVEDSDEDGQGGTMLTLKEIRP